MEREFEWSMPPVRFVLSRGCVEAVVAAAEWPEHRHHDPRVDRTITTARDVRTVANAAIRRTTVRENVVADAGTVFSGVRFSTWPSLKL